MRSYFDTNVFIAAFETAGATADHAWRLLNAAEEERIEAVTSELTLAELLSKPPPDNPELISRYADMVTDRPGLSVRSVDRAILLQAATLRREKASLKLPDAIHLATAALGGCSFFLSGDVRLRNASAVTIIRLGPHALDTIEGIRR